MSPSLESAIKAAIARLDHYICVHRDHLGISFADHVRKRRLDTVTRARSFKLIYLDTNAWKWVADYRQGKPTLPDAIKEFGASIERAVGTGRFAFPIGVPTFFELDSMVDPTTQAMLKNVVDELSQGLCITSYHDRIGSELKMLRENRLSEAAGLGDFLCSPIEMMGIPTIALPGFVKEKVDQTTFNKAFFDALYELPFSIQLEMAKDTEDEKWDNESGIDDLNDGKIQHQSKVVNLNTGIFLELKGSIDAWFINEDRASDHLQVSLDAMAAMYHWKQKPASRELLTMRIISSLYGLMRFDPNRRYKKGDPNDFMIAASALPVAQAFFTDKKLANLLADTRIGFGKFLNCTVVSGPENMAQYLKEQMSSDI